MPSHPDRVRKNYRFWAAYDAKTKKRTTPGFESLSRLIKHLESNPSITKDRFVYDKCLDT